MPVLRLRTGNTEPLEKSQRDICRFRALFALCFTGPIGDNIGMDLLPPPSLAPAQAGLSRRQFLRAASLLPGMALLPTSVLANDFWSRPRELWLRRRSTGEEIRAVYLANGQLQTDGYVALCKLLRDAQAGQAVQMDLVLLDILRGVYGWFDAAGMTRPIDINSGYRTVHTNSKEGGARNSMHTYGKAADLRMEGVPTAYMAKLGMYLAGGGVGYYAQKGFVHVDTGRLRSWTG